VFDTEGGSIIGLRGLYHATPNLAFGVEVNATNAGYVGFLSSINSRAIMAIARYTVPVTDTVDIYGTIGLGSIRVEYDGASDFPAFTGTDQVWGGQIALGVAFALSPNIGVFGELIHQAAFEDASIVSTAVEYRSTNVAVGLRFRF
jgi:opacity protein-like surface antigen